MKAWSPFPRLEWTRDPDSDGPGPAMRAALPGILEAVAWRATTPDGEERRAWLAGDGRQGALYVLEVEGSPSGAWPSLELIHDAILELAPGAAFTFLGGWLLGTEPLEAPSSVVLVQAGAVAGSPAARRLELSNVGGSPHGTRPQLLT